MKLKRYINRRRTLSRVNKYYTLYLWKKWPANFFFFAKQDNGGNTAVHQASLSIELVTSNTNSKINNNKKKKNDNDDTNDNNTNNNNNNIIEEGVLCLRQT